MHSSLRFEYFLFGISAFEDEAAMAPDSNNAKLQATIETKKAY